MKEMIFFIGEDDRSSAGRENIKHNSKNDANKREDNEGNSNHGDATIDRLVLSWWDGGCGCANLNRSWVRSRRGSRRGCG